MADGTVSDSVLLTFTGNTVQPFIRFDLGDRLRFLADPCPCGSPFRSFQVEGRSATVLRVGGTSLSSLVFDPEHPMASRVQLVQTAGRRFEIRAELEPGTDAAAVFDAVVGASVKGVIIGDSVKFHEVVPLRHAIRN